MEVVENTLPVELEEFLARPLFCFLGTVAEDGAPRVTPLWFHWEDGAIWIIANTEKTYPARIERDPRCDLAIVDFDRESGLVQHVGMRGRASIEPLDVDRVERLLSRYLGEDPKRWDDERFGDPHKWGENMVLLRIDPETVVARDQSYESPFVEQ